MRRAWSLLVALFSACRCQASLQGDGCYSMLNGCCSLCNPGYYLREMCGPCVPCPTKGYTDKPNSQSSCSVCRRCGGIFQYESPCSATRNAVCGCKPGKKCADEACSQCENNPCPAGQQLKRGGECEACPRGTFNPGTEGTCKPWKSCWAPDAVLLVNGTATSDVLCGHPPAKPTRTPATSATTSVPKVAPANNGVDVVIPILTSAAFFVVLFVVIVFCLLLKLEKIKNKFRPIKQTKDEDGCSCHFPEEEDGEGCCDAAAMTLPAA